MPAWVQMVCMTTGNHAWSDLSSMIELTSITGKLELSLACAGQTNREVTSSKKYGCSIAIQMLGADGNRWHRTLHIRQTH